MTERSLAGPTAFVLAGGGTKGSFEVGALQYLVGTERIVPDIIAATSAGAVAAAVLAQARTFEEFARRVQEVEEDILAMTRTEQIFGEQAWLQALEGTTLGGEIRSAFTKGTRPPLPALRCTVSLDPDPRAERAPPGGATRPAAAARRWVRRLLAGAALRLPRARRRFRTSGSSILNLQAPGPRHAARGAQRDPPGRSGPDPAARAPAPPGRHRAARRCPALRDPGRHHRRRGRPARRPRARAPDRSTCSKPSSPRPAFPWCSLPAPLAGRRLRRRRGPPGRARARRGAAGGATRIIAVLAVPLRIDRDERNYSDDNAINVGLRALGVIAMADRQRENLAVTLPPGGTLTTIDPVVDVVGYFEVEPGLLRINKDYGWLRAADVMAEGDATLLDEVAADTHRLIAARLEAWHMEETVWDGDRIERRRRSRNPLPSPRAQAGGARPGRPAQAAGLPGPRRLRGVVDPPRGPRELTAGPQTVGPPSQPRRLKSTTSSTTAITSVPIPSTKKVHVTRDVSDQIAEVLPEEPGEEAQRQEDRGDDGQLLHHHIEAVRHRGEVRVHHAGQEVTVAVDQIGQPDQVVVEVAEVPCRLGGQAGHGR